jgi:hypothetical protein
MQQQPAAAKVASGDWSSPGLATPEDEHAPKFFKTASGVKVQELAPGSGPTAQTGDFVLFDYVLRRANGYFIYGALQWLDHGSCLALGTTAFRGPVETAGACLKALGAQQPCLVAAHHHWLVAHTSCMLAQCTSRQHVLCHFRFVSKYTICYPHPVLLSAAVTRHCGGGQLPAP